MAKTGEKEVGFSNFIKILLLSIPLKLKIQDVIVVPMFAPMRTTYITSTYFDRTYRFTGRRSLFWNKVADYLLCGVSTLGMIVALFFLLTL